MVDLLMNSVSAEMHNHYAGFTGFCSPIRGCCISSLGTVLAEGQIVENSKSKTLY